MMKMENSGANTGLLRRDSMDLRALVTLSFLVGTFIFPHSSHCNPESSIDRGFVMQLNNLYVVN